MNRGLSPTNMLQRRTLPFGVEAVVSLQRLDHPC